MERWKRLLRILSEEQYTTNTKLADELRVSKRTVYNDIASLNEELLRHGAEIQTKPHYGVILKVTDRALFDAYMEMQQEDTGTAADTSETRVRQVILKLLSPGEDVKFDDLCDELFISRSTLKTDLKKVRTVLEKYDLTIESSAYRGSRIRGSEKNIRRCLAEISRSMMDESGRKLGDDMKVIAGVISDVFHEYRYRMPELAFHNLVIHIYTAVMRVRLGCTIEAPEGFEQYTDENVTRIAEEIFRRIEERFSLHFPAEELNYIMLHLKSKQWLSEENHSVVTADIYEAVTEMLEEIHQMFGYDFRYDFELISMLAMHLASLKVRILYDLSMDNPLLEEIREEALLSYEMANVASSRLTERYGKKITPDEMAYIALHFHLAVERHKEKHKRNILIVCGTGRGSAELLAYRVKREYGKYLNVAGTHESTDFTDVDFSRYDYILTSVHIEEKLPVPIIEIHTFRSAENHEKLDAQLRSEVQSRLLDFFDERLFLPHMKCRTKEEVLKTLSDLVIRHGFAGNDFYDHVMRREQLGSTSFGNRIAIPHPYRPEGDRSFVAAGILEEPVDWDGEEVQLVLLLSMKKDGEKNLQLFYRSVGKLLGSRDALNRILTAQNFETLISVLDALQ